ncbi:MAG TPA: glycosyltransferase family 87 protein [Candidatus Saccharimonadales bacterium]|nr:glycosyltransferase family 87 protein [Candidatus Saccharimonadales bacterium]
MVERLAVAVGTQAPGSGLRTLGDGMRSPAMRRRGMLLIRVVAIASAVAGVLDFVIAPLQGRFTGEFEDYKDYLAAANAVTQHNDIYGSFLNHVQPIPVQGFDYPPIVAWLLQPLAGLPSTTAATAWLFVLLGCTVAGTAIIAFELLPATWPRVELTAIFALLYAPVTYNLWHGQMSAVVYLFLALALRSWLRGKQISLGMYIGIAALIKIAPVLLVVLVVRRRWWAACASLAATLTVGVGGGILTLGAGTLREYVTRVLPVIGQQNGWVYNQSAAGAMNRLVGHSVLAFQQSSLALTVVTVLVAVAAVAVAAWLVRPNEVSRDIRGGEFAVGILAMLLAGSVTWFWHLGALLIVLASVAALVAGGAIQRPRMVVVAGWTALLTTGLIAPIVIASVSMTGLAALSRTWLWWPALQLISAPAFAIGALFLILVVALRPQSPPATA